MLKFNLRMGIGAPASPIVKDGDEVKRGQKIADFDPEQLSVPIYSSVNGKVKEVTDEAIYIEKTDDNKEYLKIDKKDNLADVAREAGIIGLGGAGFPTYVKLNTDLKGEGYLLINASECEPILEHNITQIRENPQKFIDAVKLVKENINAKMAFIAMKIIHTEEIKALTKLLKENNITDIRVFPLKNMYPVGEERAIIRDVLNQLLSVTDLPNAADAVVMNSETTIAIYDAYTDGKPLIDKMMTVAGNLNDLGKNEYAVRTYPIGTILSDIIEEFGGVRENSGEIIIGGPYTGHTMLEKEILSKTVGGIIVADPCEQVTNLGIIRCACGPNKDRLLHIAEMMGVKEEDLVGYETCKNAKEVKPGVFKCQNPGICPGQAEKVLNLYKNGATDILIGHCTDCSNTVAANVAKIPVEMHHATDHAKDSMGLERTRAMK